jgi:phenylpropionate dioxygenase-like ring-hydroxylating dioxygenase large terminal subunit
MSKTEWPVALAKGWHPVARASELKDKALARTLMDVPLVVFQGSDGPAVFMDRCPHRGTALSGGRVREGAIECPYHGWRFGSDGACRAVPGSTTVPEASAQRLPVMTRAGLIWTSLVAEPDPFPALPPEMDDDRLDQFWWVPAASEARVLDAVENLLDPAHPHFLHPRLVRAPDKRREVQVTLRLGPGGGEARYVEADTALTWLPRLFEGSRTHATGRYFAPATGQVAFENQKGLSLAISVVFAPESANRTRPYAHFATRRGWMPAWFKRAVLIGFHIPVLRQDQRALAAQARAIARFGGHDYHVGPLDLFGPTIWRLANGRTQVEETRELIMRL